jgi:hypothetical protein
MGYLAVKLLTGLLKSGEKCDHPDIKSLEDFVNYLEKKHDLLKVVFENFEHYMSKVQVEVAKHVKVDDFESKIIADMFMHGDQVTERLQFFKFYTHSSSSVKLTADNLITLWDLLALSKIDTDQKVMY